MKKVPFLRSEFVWGLLRLIDEFKIISLSSDFGFITSSSALHICVHQGSADQVDIRWSLRTRRVQLGLNQTAKIYYSIFISILFFLNEGSNERKNGFHGIDDSKVHTHYFWQTILKTTRLEFSNAKSLILTLLHRVIDFHLETSYCEKIKSSSIEVDWGQFGKQVYSNQLEPRGWFQLTV